MLLWRLLLPVVSASAIEMGMKNHELVPTPLICTIAGLSAGPGAAFKIINTLHRNKLIYHENKTCPQHARTLHACCSCNASRIDAASADTCASLRLHLQTTAIV